jgi:two-component system, cell cycle sensor histidine kinase and response regulator CckA
MSKILIVDDVPSSCHLLDVLFRANGYETAVAQNGAAALEIIRSGPVDLIVSDILMPVMDGFELCRRCKDDERTRAIPFAFYTATYTNPADERFALSLGADRFVIKPARPEALLTVVREVLHDSNRGQRAAECGPLGPEMEFFRQHNAVLFKKLEDKMLQLEREIAERTRAEQALRESEVRYHRLHESMRDAFVLMDMSGHILEANQAYQEMLGYDAEELSRLTYQQLTPESWHAADARIVAEEILPLGHSRVFQKEYIRKDGTVFPVEMRKFLLRGEAGEPTGMCGVARDITERMRAEAELRFRTVLLATQQEASLDGILVVDEHAQIVSFNRRFVEMWGIPPELVEKKDDAPVLRLVTEQVAAPGSFLERVEYLYQHARETSRDEILLKDGRIFDRYSAPMFGPDNRYYGRVWYFRDVTERKQAVDALRESEERYRHLFELMEQGVVYQAADGSVVSANPAAARIFGLTQEQMRGRTCTDPRWRWLREDGSDLPGDEHPVIVALRSGQPVPGMVMGVFHSGAGAHRWILLDAVPEFRPGEATPFRVYTSFVDITGRRRLEEQLREAQKMDAIGRLAGGVAHDFNNALAVILGFSEQALVQLGPLDPLRHNLAEIVRTVEKSAALTRQLLAFARRQIAVPKVVDLNGAIASLQKILSRLIGGEDVDMRIVPGTGLWNVKIDPSQLDQILVNLVTNARDAIPNTGTITVETSDIVLGPEHCRQYPGIAPGEYVCLAVSDSGIGMDKATLQRVFEPFFTTKPEGKGTGLGLPTVYGIAKQNGGFVDVHSEPGHGTTFKLYLPRSIEEPAQPTEKKEPRSLRGTETVLIVEDEPALLDIVAEGLQGLGYKVLTAGSPGDAVLLCEKHAGMIHLLVTDVVMPTMNGKDLQQRLGRIRPGLRTIFMSGYTANVVADRGIVDTDMLFIQKPFTLGALASKIREALED